MFYENFQRICEERGTSPFAVTQKLGMSKNTAAYWKKNDSIPKQCQLTQLAEILNCTVADFFADPAQKGFKAAVTNVMAHAENGDIGDIVASAHATGAHDLLGIMTDEERELLRIYRELSVMGRARLMIAADELAAGEFEKKGTRE